MITSLNFPRVLEEKGGLDGAGAINLAADYVNAYGLLIRGDNQGYSEKPYTYEASQIDAFWDPQYKLLENRTNANYYRAAATFALAAQGIEGPLILTCDQPSQPYPPHIASLHNPLSELEARVVHEIVADGQLLSEL